MENKNVVTSRYAPEVFNVRNLGEAKEIILTPVPGTTTEERWKLETAYLTRLIGETFRPNAETCLLDYGCGVGRLAKELIHTFGCSVLVLIFQLR